jgi:hypothetical protein
VTEVVVVVVVIEVEQTNVDDAMHPTDVISPTLYPALFMSNRRSGQPGPTCRSSSCHANPAIACAR